MLQGWDFHKEICTNNTAGRAGGINVHKLFALEVVGEMERRGSSWLWWDMGTDPWGTDGGSCAEEVQKLLCVTEDAEIHGLEGIPSRDHPSQVKG